MPQIPAAIKDRIIVAFEECRKPMTTIRAAV
jgi:hypothetical protein